MAQVQARKDKIVKGLTGGIELLFKKNKIDWIKGSGRLAGGGKVEVTDGRQADADRAGRQIIVATGSQPRSVPGIEIDRKRIITSDEAIDMKEVPKSIAIMGSGAVGVEFASIFRRFGSEVTIIELLPRLVPIEDEAVSAELERSFKKQGIKVLTGTKVTSATPGADGVELEAQARRRQDVEDQRGVPARGDRPRTGDERPRRRGARAADGARLHPRRSRLPHQRRRHLGHRRRHHLRCAGPPAARAPVVGRGHRAGRAHRRSRVTADQLRPGAGLHLLRSGDRQRRA